MLTNAAENKPNWVNKLEAAKRHIRAAIRLHFEELDPLPLHSIVAAVHTVLKDLSELKGSRSMVKPPGYDRAINFAENFLKHADRDPESRINEAPLPEITALLLFDSVVMLQNVMNELPFEAKLYWGWYLVNNEQEFLESGSAIRGIMEHNQHLKSMSFPEIRQFLRFQQATDTSEPLPPWAPYREVA